MRIDVGAGLNLLFSQRHIQSLGWPVHMEDREWRDQHLPAAKPAAGFDREVADCPGLIVEVELIYSSKLSVRGLNRETFQKCDIRQHCLCPPGRLYVTVDLMHA